MPNTQRIFEFFESKYGLGYLGLIKSIAAASIFVTNTNIIPLSVLVVAPSGQFKSRSTIEVQSILGKKQLIDLGSDFTIHSLIDKFDAGKKCNSRTLCINDLTLLFSSKQPRTKERLINAFAEVLSEGRYLYGERNAPDLKFESHINILANITLNSYNQNNRNFIDNTFIERLFPFFYELSEDKQISFSREEATRKSMVFEGRIKLKKTLIVNYEDFKEQFLALASEYKVYAQSPSLSRCTDKIKAIAGGICVLNQTNRIDLDAISLIGQLIQFSTKFDTNKAEILALYRKGKSVEEITIALGYTSNYPYKVVQEFRNKGVINSPRFLI